MEESNTFKCKEHLAKGVYICSVPLCQNPVLCFLCYKNHSTSHLTNLYPFNNGNIEENAVELFNSINLDKKDYKKMISEKCNSTFQNIFDYFTEIKKKINKNLEKKLEKIEIWRVKDRICRYENKFKDSWDLVDIINYTQILDSTIKNNFMINPLKLQNEVKQIEELIIHENKKIHLLGDSILEHIQKVFSKFLSEEEFPEYQNDMTSKRLGSNKEGKINQFDIQKTNTYLRTKIEYNPEEDKKSIMKVFELISAVNHSESISRINHEDEFNPNSIIERNFQITQMNSGNVSPNLPMLNLNEKDKRILSKNFESLGPFNEYFSNGKIMNQNKLRRTMSGVNNILSQNEKLRNSHSNRINKGSIREIKK
jgi:hypothetical protein